MYFGLYEAIVGYGRPRVTLDRAVVFTESFRETEHEPLVVGCQVKGTVSQLVLP